MFSKLFKITSHFHQYSEEAIIKKIRKYRCVSFDVFDTLVKRNCSAPEQVFSNLMLRYNAERGEQAADPAAFRRDRIEAARTAKEEAAKNGISEITLDDIYRVLSAKYPDSDTLKEMEIQEEINCCFPNMPLKRVFEECLNQGKKVFLISDMYLSDKTIGAMLEKCGYSGYTELLVSSQVGLKKRDGRLFRYYMEKYQLRPSECVHIGDSFVSDYLYAKKSKIRSVCIATYPRRTVFCRAKGLSGENREAYKKLRLILNDGTDPKWSDYKKFGFECLGPMLYYFATWLHREICDKSIDKVFFLSRDGYLIKSVYDTVYADSKSEYLHISRRAVHVPLFHKMDSVEEYLLLNGANKRWSVVTVCNRLGLDPGFAKEQWKRAGLCEDASFRVDDIKNNEKLKAFFDAVHAQAVKVSEEEYDACKTYLANKGFSGRIAIVDTGGNGTTQKCLDLLRSKGAFEADVTGYYLWSYNLPDESFKVYPCTEHRLAGGETVVCELPLTANEGTTVKYRFTGKDTAEPLLDTYEFEGNQEILQIIDEIHAGALRFAEIMKTSANEVANASVAYQNAKMATRHPRMREVRLFGDLYFCSDNENTYLAKPRPLLFYMVKPKSFLNEFKLVRWKIGFLKRLIKLPLPYFGILRAMKGKG